MFPGEVFIARQCKSTNTRNASTLTSTSCNVPYMPLLKDRIIEAREAAGLDKAGLVRAVRPFTLTHSALSQLESGKTKSLKASTAVAIARATGFRPEYLVNGTLPKRNEQPARTLLDLPPRAGGKIGLAVAPASNPIKFDYLLAIVRALLNAGVDLSTPKAAELVAKIYDVIEPSERKPTVSAIRRMLRSA